MLLETFKSLVARFKKNKPAREESVTQPALLPHFSKDKSPALVSSTSNPPTVLDPTTTPGFLAYSHHNVINNPTMVSNIFEAGGGAIIQLLESKTIRGAEHDSSARYPPPRCHPATRQTLRKQIFDWILNPLCNWRMVYILGPAGVGKSAVAQTVADDCKEADCLGASCFISRPNHRNDPDGVVPTLAYQLAVKHSAYKQIVSQKLAHDPTILRKTRRVQFKELLIDPFHIIMSQDASAIQKPLLIIIDGLDECENQAAQCEFIELIGDHVRSFPEFPLLWLICSRPESHIKYVLSQADFQVTCRREEMLVDDEESQRDVLIYLLSEFKNIRLQYQDSLDDDWPPANDLLRIAKAASGLFAFASTITRFVGDANAGDPSNQLQVFTTILEGSKMAGVENPYLTLDLLYQHILASVPSKILPIAMRIIGFSIFYAGGESARTQANFLKIRKTAFDHALKQLHSVLRIGSSSDAFDGPIKFYHASFGDFLRDPERSGEFCLDEVAIHYDTALTALNWLMGSGREIQKDDMWISQLENAQTCLEITKQMSLSTVWKACSCVQNQNAVDLYQKLQKFDFSILDRCILDYVQFGEFLGWLNLQERDSSNRKLLNSLTTYKDCNETKFTEAIVEEASLTGFIPPGFVTREPSEEFDMPKNIHLNLGDGTRCRHIHIIVETQKNSHLNLDVFQRDLLANIPSIVLPTTLKILGLTVFYPLRNRSQRLIWDQTVAGFLHITKSEFHRAMKMVNRIAHRFGGSPLDKPIRFNFALHYYSAFTEFLKDPARSGRFCLDEDAIHYDTALTALGWLMVLGREIEKDDDNDCISRPEDAGTCPEDVKSLSLAVLWRACSLSQGENATDLYSRLQQLNFNVLDCHISFELEFGEFLSWLKLRERDVSTPKLLNSIATYEDCDKREFSVAYVHKASLPGFMPEGFATQEPFNLPKIFHLNLGHGIQCRHIHIVTFSRLICLN